VRYAFYVTGHRLVLVAGLPGAGKSTIARRVAESFSPSMHLQVDQLRTMMVRGYITPDQAQGWSQAFAQQFIRESRAATALATSLHDQGVTVILDDVALPPIFHACYAQVPALHRVLLMPSIEALLKRLRLREDQYDAVFQAQAPMLHAMLAQRDKTGWAVLDTSDWSVEQTVARVLQLLGTHER
jgi:predicted kinase